MGVNWAIGTETLTDEQMERVTKLGLKKTTVRSRIRCGWSMDKATSDPPHNPPGLSRAKNMQALNPPPLRTIVRRRTLKQLEKGIADLQRQGYKPVMDKPVIDPSSSFPDESYVMVMEHPTMKRTGTKTWG